MVDIYYSRVASNTFIVYNEHGEGFLVDPGNNKDNVLIEHIKKINVDIKAILITHAHYDHITALKDVCDNFPNAKVYISFDEVEILKDPRLNLSYDRHDGGEENLDYVPNNLQTVCDREKIECAGINIKVIATPFHTIGSVCYYVDSEKALFSGDTLFFSTIGRTDLPTGSNKTIASSLRKLILLPDGVKVYPGHSACTSLDREKKYNSYLKNI